MGAPSDKPPTLLGTIKEVNGPAGEMVADLIARTYICPQSPPYLAHELCLDGSYRHC